MQNTLPLIQELDQLRQRALQEQKRLTVFFADLCGSTSYKIERGPIEGLRKTYVHNDTVARVIKSNGGAVTKFIGDEVMGTFEGDSATTQAIRTAYEIQFTFSRSNDAQSLKGIDRILSKVGIHSGPVHIFRFEGHDAEDPQGTTVDLAARVVALAKPEQVLCTKQVADESDRSKLEEIDVTLSAPVLRELKGIKEKVSLVEICWDSNKERGITEVAHQSKKVDIVDDLLSKAREGQINGNADQVMDNLWMILRHDPEHFAANILLTEFYYREKRDYPKALEHARRARDSNPYSCVARQRASTLPWHAGQELDDSKLDALISEVEEALSIAVEELNSYVEATSRNALAYFYAQRYANGRDPKDFEKALFQCRALEYRYNKLHRHDYAAFLDTHAFQSDKKADLEKALEYAAESEKSVPNLYYPMATRLGIMKKMDRLGFLGGVG